MHIHQLTAAEAGFALYSESAAVVLRDDNGIEYYETTGEAEARVSELQRETTVSATAQSTERVSRLTESV